MRSTWMAVFAATPLALIVLSMGGEASGDPPSEGSVACAQDATNLCQGVKPGGGRVLECLARKEAQLSPACKTTMAPVSPHIIAWRNACGTDVDQHCSTMAPTSLMLSCLGAHWSTLAQPCKTKINEAVLYRSLVCAKDTKTHCQGVSAGAGRIVECLHGHQSTLEPACRQQIDYEAKWVMPWRQACGADADRLCASALGTWQVLACLDKHKPKVSQVCKTKVEAEAQRFNAVCGPDISTHCNGVQPGDGRIVTCLHEHRLALRPLCKAIVP